MLEDPEKYEEKLSEFVSENAHRVVRLARPNYKAVSAEAGALINQDILKEGRAEYDEAIVSTLSRHLLVEYGRGFSAKNLRHMIRFAEVFADESIVSTLWRRLDMR